MIKSIFLSKLDILLDVNDCSWTLAAPLQYYSEMLNSLIIVPTGFQTDLASVPRFPLVFDVWGARAHRESVIHDYLYCVGAFPDVTYAQANQIFLEAMKSRGVHWYIRWPMYLAVCAGGWFHWKKRSCKVNNCVQMVNIDG